MARLKMKLGEEGECERLQHAVLHMRSSALGLHHEDTHRSAMDVYTRRRNYAAREQHDQQGYVDMGTAMDTCFEMLQHASLEQGGTPTHQSRTRAGAAPRARSVLRAPRE